MHKMILSMVNQTYIQFRLGGWIPWNSHLGFHWSLCNNRGMQILENLKIQYKHVTKGYAVIAELADSIVTIVSWILEQFLLLPFTCV